MAKEAWGAQNAGVGRPAYRLCRWEQRKSHRPVDPIHTAYMSMLEAFLFISCLCSDIYSVDIPNFH